MRRTRGEPFAYHLAGVSSRLGLPPGRLYGACDLAGAVWAINARVTVDIYRVTKHYVLMDYVTDKDREEIEASKSAIVEARKLRNRVLARIRKRRQRAKQ